MKVISNNWQETIASGLAEQGFAIFDNFLSLQEVIEVLDVLELEKQNDRFRKAGIGKSDDRQIIAKIRGDYIKWIDPNHALLPVKNFLNKMESLVDYLNRTCFLGIQDYETHFTVYPKGTRYVRHLDQFQDKGNRVISFVCYLNHEWTEADGGQLRLYLANKHFDVLPTAGRLACFVSSEIEHEVLECHKERYSITGWMLNQQKSLDFLD
ncbi:MAG: 2OG-Fe(II) oxygenase [Fulvivirga sp.]|nr:2OG-Fe(II) oxygenase [Fulvivirga sp.]